MRLPRIFRRSRSEPVSQADLAKWFGGGPSWSGIDVDRTSAMGVSAVWSCVRLISETMAALPLVLLRRRNDGGTERATEHPLYRLLHDQPNPERNSFLWREQQQQHVLIMGNCYSQVVRERGVYPAGLWPLDPERMKVGRDGTALLYTYRTQDGAEHVLTPSDVLHIPGLGWDGLIGYPVLTMHAQGIGSAIAAERYGSEFFKNGAEPHGYIKMVGSLKDDAARKRLRESWQDVYGEWGNKHKTGILEQGAEYVQTTIPPEQAQFIETRRYSRSEIASIFRVPPHLIGDVDRSTSWGTGIEQQTIGFVVYTLMPWLVRWEQCLDQQLLMEDERGTYFFKFELKGLLRGDLAARTNFYNAMLDRGVFHADDVLALEDMNPQEGGVGKTYFIASNMQTKERAINPPEPTPVAGGST